jgi:hypothetical protein
MDGRNRVLIVDLEADDDYYPLSYLVPVDRFVKDVCQVFQLEEKTTTLEAALDQMSGHTKETFPKNSSQVFVALLDRWNDVYFEYYCFSYGKAPVATLVKYFTKWDQIH